MNSTDFQGGNQMTHSNDKTRRAVIYARTEDFTLISEPDSLAYQVDLNNKYCEMQGYVIVATFEEIAPGSMLQRDEFLKLRQAMEQRAFDVIVVSSFDRISEVDAIVQAFIIEAEGKGFWIESVTEPGIDIQDELLL
jgi:predicted site-specific integrase-resolvase